MFGASGDLRQWVELIYKNLAIAEKWKTLSTPSKMNMIDVVTGTIQKLTSIKWSAFWSHEIIDFGYVYIDRVELGNTCLIQMEQDNDTKDIVARHALHGRAQKAPQNQSLPIKSF